VTGERGRILVVDVRLRWMRGIETFMRMRWK
jgi:hypothetical protein